MIEIKVPPVGESINEVSLLKWIKKNGEYVERDEVIAELESEKATFEVNATESGVLMLKAQEGDTLQVGQTLAEIDASAEQKNTAPAQLTTQQEQPKPSAPQTTAEQPKAEAAGKGMIDLTVPSIGESITEVTLLKWVKPDGALVNRDEIVAEFESEKATFELNASESGQLKHLAKEGDVLAIGQTAATINSDIAVDNTTATPAPESKPATSEAPVTSVPNDIKTSPVAAAIIADKHVDVKQIKASGTQGKIMKNDVLQALQNPGKQAFNGQQLYSRNERREKMSNLRKTISRRLVEAKNTTAMLTTFNEVDMGAIMQIRKQYKDAFNKSHGVNLGFMSFFAKACAVALSEWPAVNAYIDGDELIYHDYADISIAVSTPRGLTVPVIRNVESLSMAEVEMKVIEVAAKARDSKLTAEDLQGGTFTITNGGVFGSLMSTPIINIPQSAILGMHKIQDRAMVIDGQITIRPMMYLALSYDHRIIDGKESVSFLVRVKELLENPEQLLIGKDPVKTLLGL